MYSLCVSFSALTHWALKVKKNKLLSPMNEVVVWILVIVGISIPPVVAVLLEHYFNRKKRAAETEKIRLQNKITKEITYDQLKTESKQKDIKGKIDIFQRLIKLEEEIKSKKTITAGDQKKLESLEMIKKEFKQSFGTEENPKLVEVEKKLEAKKENNKEIKNKTLNKKVESAKTNFRSKNQKKRKSK
ncbi:protein of unknown function [endosymbiont DhMRE of Dentiscutata heterogama]|nr:protein of unknown function [endosymbiont DhMRE of Dentiscutata heterogama]